MGDYKLVQWIGEGKDLRPYCHRNSDNTLRFVRSNEATSECDAMISFCP